MLGYGASAGVAHGYNQLRSDIEQRAWDAGIINPSYHPGPELIRLYGGYNSRSTRYPYVAHLGRGQLRSMMWEGLLVSRPPRIGNPYRVFNLINSDSCLFNFNVDGVAEQTCFRHRVLSPHGSLLRLQPIMGLIAAVTKANLEFGLNSRVLEGIDVGLTLSTPESSDITSKRSEYHQAIKLFPKYRSVIIIGFSFGKVENSIDDSETLSFLTEMLRRYPKDVFVVDIAPEHTAGLIDRQCPNVRVIPVQSRWRPFALALRRLALTSPVNGLSALPFASRVISEMYRYTCDIDDELGSTTSVSDRVWKTLKLDRCGDFRDPLTSDEIQYLISE